MKLSIATTLALLIPTLVLAQTPVRSSPVGTGPGIQTQVNEATADITRITIGLGNTITQMWGQIQACQNTEAQKDQLAKDKEGLAAELVEQKKVIAGLQAKLDQLGSGTGVAVPLGPDPEHHTGPAPTPSPTH